MNTPLPLLEVQEIPLAEFRDQFLSSGSSFAQVFLSLDFPMTDTIELGSEELLEIEALPV